MDSTLFFKRLNVGIRCFLPHIAKTTAPTLESQGGIPCLCLLAHTRQLSHSTQNFLGCHISPHTVKGNWTANTMLCIRHHSAWFVGTKILHWGDLMCLKHSLQCEMITLYQSFTDFFMKRDSSNPGLPQFQSKARNTPTKSNKRSCAS